VFYPGIELVTDAELSAESDPYLDDHVLQGERLFPAVMALEAMAQASSAVLESAGAPVFERVTFDHPIVVPHRERVVVRIAALAREPDRVDIVVRSGATGFLVDHFRATCRPASGDLRAGTEAPSLQGAQDAVPIVPQRDLYGRLLFHQGRFTRISGYRRLTAAECAADLIERDENWFGRFMPQDLLLGDPGARDAATHAVQACIPHAQVVPVGVERIMLHTSRVSGLRTVTARERRQEGETFVYDLAVRDETGDVREEWAGLRLRAVTPAERPECWHEALLGPYLERRMRELVPGSRVAAVVERGDGSNRRARGDHALRQVLGSDGPVHRRPDGKPQVLEAVGLDASVAYAGALTLAVAGSAPVGCDVECVIRLDESEWRGLLGSDFALIALVAAHLRDGPETAAVRVWAARECLKKAGAPAGGPLVCGFSDDSGWIVLRSGALSIATFAARVRDVPDPLVFAILTGSDGARV
jgi:enediyne polyketide synthase